MRRRLRVHASLRYLGLVLAAAAVLLANALLVRDALERRDELSSISSSNAIRNQVDHLSDILLRMDAYSAAYLSSGRKDYYSAFQHTQKDIQEVLTATIRAFKSQDIRPRALTLKRDIGKAVAQMSDQVTRHHDGKPDAARPERDSLKAIRQLTDQLDDLVVAQTRRATQEEKFQEKDLSQARAHAMLWSAVTLAFLLAGFLWIQRDLRRQMDENRRLTELADEDGLTGLKNHRSFQEQLQKEWRRAQRHGMPLSLLILDVDHFKPYNDAYGHPEGDTALRLLAGALEHNARLTDCVARYGGEEFALLLPHAGLDEAVTVAQRVQSTLARAPWPHRPLTVSIGVATLSPDMDSPDAFITAADRALYRAKQTGRNRIIYV